MLSMHYAIALPSDYDMAIIKNRVRDNGGKTDGFPDLKMKAYLVAEKTKYGNPSNRYAPFYLWEKTEGMNQFLLGGPFNNILGSFGRPMVHTWLVLHAQVGKTAKQQYAVVETMRIADSPNFDAFRERERENFIAATADPATIAYAVAYNPQTWELCRFHMATDREKMQRTAKGLVLYDVYHVS